MIEPSFFIRDSPSHGVQFGHPGSGPDPSGPNVLSADVCCHVDMVKHPMF
jgi:hypothetical protein